MNSNEITEQIKEDHHYKTGSDWIALVERMNERIAQTVTETGEINAAAQRVAYRMGSLADVANTFNVSLAWDATSPDGVDYTPYLPR